MPKPKTSARKPAAGKTSSVPSAPSVPSSSLEVFTPDQRIVVEDAQLAHQLRDQYQRAIGGMREVLKFGAMLMRLRDIVSTRGHDRSRGGGRDTTGEGLKGWLAQHCPEISRSTAYRFLGIAEAVEGEYRALVGVKIAKSYTLPDLVAADPRDLPEHIAAKQLELFEYVDGTSQRSWLDRFKAPALKGGARPRSSADQLPDAGAEERGAIDLWAPIIKDLHEEIRAGSWAHLPDKGPTSREALHDVCTEIVSLLREANRKPARSTKAPAIIEQF